MVNQIAFLRQPNGTTHDLHLPSNVNSQATGVKDFGTAVGFYQPTSTTSEGLYVDANGNSNGFVYSDDKFTTVDVPGASQTTIDGINDFGIINGFSVNATTGATQGFVGAKNISLSALDLKADLLPHSSGLAHSVVNAISHIAETLPGLFGSHLTNLSAPPALIIGHHG